jgi:hypothetical protein
MTIDFCITNLGMHCIINQLHKINIKQNTKILQTKPETRPAHGEQDTTYYTKAGKELHNTENTQCGS